MTVTILDPEDRAYRHRSAKGIVGYPTVHPIGGVLASATAPGLMRSGAAVCRWCWSMSRVVHRAAPNKAAASRHAGDWADFVPELNAQPDDVLVNTKKTWGASPTPISKRG